MNSIKKQYILSCAMVTSISVVALGIMSFGNAALHRHSVNVTSNLLPFTLMLNDLSENVSTSLELLNSWVLMANEESKHARQVVWEKDIFPLVERATLHIKESNDVHRIEQLAALKSKLKALHTSQWWVEDVSQFIGNQPALVIYQRDLLPVYYRIQSALNGVTHPQQSTSHASELRLIVSNTHLLLSETIHQLSEAILTGDLTHLKHFKEGAEQVREYIVRIKESPGLSNDAANLVNWIERQYSVYIALAEDVIQTRQASDWNRGIYIIGTETEILTKDIKQLLLEMQNLQIEALKKDTKWAEDSTYKAFVLALSLVFICALLAAFLTVRNSRRIVRQIKQLKTAALSIAHGKLDVINVTYHDELGDLAKVFNQMQRTILRRRKKYVRERERLNEVIKVITHDMKSPLININGHAELIHNEFQHIQQNDEETRNKLAEIEASQQHIKKSTQRIDELIGGILEYSATSYKEISLSEIAPRRIVEELIQINSHRLKTTQIKLHFLTEKLISDEFVFKFVVSTLLDNAIKYQEPSRPLVIEIGSELDPTNNLVIFSIKDNGLGICNDDSDLIFKMFEKGDPNTEGYGIGLSCARSMTERLNGDLYYHSNADNFGVTFFFSMQYSLA
jgi:signal transduction histidine kinase